VSDDALECALRALRHRDRSAHEVDRRLAERGFADEEREQTLETLVRTGVVDDARFAQTRAESLATRGAGDELIRHELAGAGIDPILADEAIASLEPEIDRARRIVERRGASAKTARYLHGRGYSHDALATAVATSEAGELR
jgi:regulatory protein